MSGAHGAWSCFLYAEQPDGDDHIFGDSGFTSFHGDLIGDIYRIYILYSVITQLWLISCG